MMRLPVPVVLATLVIVAATGVVVTVKPMQSYYTINATNLELNQQMTVTLNFIPYKIYLIGNPASGYCVQLFVTNALVDSDGIASTSTSSVCKAGNQTFGPYRVLEVYGPVNATIVVQRVS